eukprot:g4976.t1
MDRPPQLTWSLIAEGGQQLAAVAGIQPLSFAPAPPAELPVVAPPGPPPELALQALETVTDLQLVEAPVEVSSETASEADPEGDASEETGLFPCSRAGPVHLRAQSPFTICS